MRMEEMERKFDFCALFLFSFFIFMIFLVATGLKIIEMKDDFIDEQHEIIFELINKEPTIITKTETITETVEVEKIVEVETKLLPVYEVTDEEFELLCKIVMWESGSEPFECKQYVCQTVLNRVDSELFPNTIYEVLYQKNQFSNINSDKFNNQVVNQDSVYAVETVLKGLFYCDSYPLYFEAGDSDTEQNFRNKHSYIDKKGETRFYEQ